MPENESKSDHWTLYLYLYAMRSPATDEARQVSRFSNISRYRSSQKEQYLA